MQYLVSFVCFYELLNRGRHSRPEVFCKKGVLRNFAKFTGLRSQTCNLIKIETLAQVFSSEFCKISQNTFFYRTPPVAVSPEVYSEPCQKLKMELFAKIVNDWKSWTIFTKALSKMLHRALNTPLLNTRQTACSCLLYVKIYYMFEIS